MFTMDMRGSGIYSYDEEIDIDCECGSTKGTQYVDDWKFVTVTCDACGEQVELDEGPDPDYERDLMLEMEYEDRY